MKNIHQYKINPEYSRSVAYFCMEYAIDQSLHIYSGGLGYLAGSHMRSAYELRQNLIGVGILWTYGYYDQLLSPDLKMEVHYVERHYPFLKDTGIMLDLTVHNHPVKAKVYFLPPDTFGTAPLFLLTTDIPENDHLARTISYKLYDNNVSTKIAQYILLGAGGYELMKRLGNHVDVYHFNEAHALPAAFALLKDVDDLKTAQDRVVFTTHTPVAAGNEIHDLSHLKDMSFFCGLSDEQIDKFSIHDEYTFNQTLNALYLSRIANGVSRMHGETARKMWRGYGYDDKASPIISITNSQNEKYWADAKMYKAVKADKPKTFWKAKTKAKEKLFKVVKAQTGKDFDPDACTIVWARRFATYKRADLITYEMDRFRNLMHNREQPVQVIWAGKPYPEDHGARDTFNKMVQLATEFENCAVLCGYELELSKLLKGAADIWLNTPRITREASGTSGMTAAMNGAINCSTYDGWIPEFAKHGENAFVIPPCNPDLPTHQKDWLDMQSAYKVLLDEAIPTYYDPEKWWQLVKRSMTDVLPYFDSGRMAAEYYKLMYEESSAPVSSAIAQGEAAEAK